VYCLDAVFQSDPIGRWRHKLLHPAKLIRETESLPANHNAPVDRSTWRLGQNRQAHPLPVVPKQTANANLVIVAE